MLASLVSEAEHVFRRYFQTEVCELQSMAPKARLLELFEGKRNQKVILTISVLIVLVLEVLIYLAAASQSGQKSKVLVLDENGSQVYESPGTALTSYEKMAFENTFGPLKNYRIQVHTENLAFPFRAWSSAAVGIPIGLILLVAFLVRCYLSLVYGDDEEAKKQEIFSTDNGRFGSVLSLFRGISIFHVGFIVVIAVLLFWIVPNFLGDIVRVTMTAFREFKYFFVAAAAFFAAVIVWVIYLRYRISQQVLRNQADLEKYRMKIELLEYKKSQALLPGPVNEAQEPQ
jgi:hypothetical protein